MVNLEQIANELYSFVAGSDAHDGYSYTGGTAEGAADYWVESWYAMEEGSRGEGGWHPATEAELMLTAALLVPLLVARGLPKA